LKSAENINLKLKSTLSILCLHLKDNEKSLMYILMTLQHNQ